MTYGRPSSLSVLPSLSCVIGRLLGGEYIWWSELSRNLWCLWLMVLFSSLLGAFPSWGRGHHVLLRKGL